jgi:hypothetical protein
MRPNRIDAQTWKRRPGVGASWAHAEQRCVPLQYAQQAKALRFRAGSHKVSYAQFLGMLAVSSPNEAEVPRFLALFTGCQH